MPEKVNVLLIGGGGREHALATRLAESTRLGELHVTHPSNPGLAALGTPVDVPVSSREFYRIEQYLDHNGIGLVVVGPEDPLAEGYADRLATPDRLVFGPTKAGARLEADKAWGKHLMRSASIPTPEARIFKNPETAIDYLRSREEPQVVKASGLAKGKGVFVPETIDEAVAAVEHIMVRRAFGDAGNEIVIEEKLVGPELSVLALVDGRNILVLPPCQDHKRLGDGDTGPNTGGMGAFCPTPTATEPLLERVERDVLIPAVDTLRREGIEYRGVLYAGLILTHAGPKVLEFNVRFGDPECQPLMARLRTDLLEIMLATCKGRLDRIDMEWDPRPSCCVVLAADGYPDNPRKGDVITGIDEARAMDDVFVFHAGTARRDDGAIITNGGRVLGVTALGDDLEAARKRAYAACDAIDFAGKTFRTDIGAGVTNTVS